MFILEHFETHLTFNADDAESLAVLQQRGQDLGLKCTHIVLAQGDYASQPMLTLHSKGILESEIAKAHQLGNQLAGDGLEVNRIKLEVDTDSKLIPQQLDDPRVQNDKYYFEYHIKLDLPNHYDLKALKQLVYPLGGHLSRNDFKSTTDRIQRFVTLRGHRCLLETAEDQFSQLLTVIEESDQITVLEIEKEYVVYDTNYQLDSGWIE